MILTTRGLREAILAAEHNKCKDALEIIVDLKETFVIDKDDEPYSIVIFKKIPIKKTKGGMYYYEGKITDSDFRWKFIVSIEELEKFKKKNNQ
jgi:hypothetical protein